MCIANIKEEDGMYLWNKWKDVGEYSLLPGYAIPYQRRFYAQNDLGFETDEPKLGTLRKFVNDDFTMLLGTDLYVKRGSPSFSLFEQEALRLYSNASPIIFAA